MILGPPAGATRLLRGQKVTRTSPSSFVLVECARLEHVYDGEVKLIAYPSARPWLFASARSRYRYLFIICVCNLAAEIEGATSSLSLMKHAARPVNEGEKSNLPSILRETFFSR